MTFSPESLISLSELSENPSVLVQRFQTQDALMLISQDRFQCVLLPYERYQSLIEGEALLDSVSSSASSHASPGEPLKIGAFVRQQMGRLFTSHQLTEQELGRLCSRDYCRTVFRMSLPVLKEVPSQCQSNPQALHEQCIDQNGYLRYYAKVQSAYGKFYIICNNWREHPHRETFTAWLNSR